MPTLPTAAQALESGSEDDMERQEGLRNEMEAATKAVFASDLTIIINFYKVFITIRFVVSELYLLADGQNGAIVIWLFMSSDQFEQIHLLIT